MKQALLLDPADNVAVALEEIPAGEMVYGARLPTRIPPGHKLAIRRIPQGTAVIKYGAPIGLATADIHAGGHVHTQNLQSALQISETYRYLPSWSPLPPEEPTFFQGYRRPDGTVGIRNEIWILPTVGCVNDTARQIAAQAQPMLGGSLEGIYAFPHPYGCGQLGKDLLTTQRALAAMAAHPNAAAVLILGLGCEMNRMEDLQAILGDYDPARIRFLSCQAVSDEFTAAYTIMEQLSNYAKQFQREPIPASELVVGLKCGGSDGFSGITGNPLVGVFSDQLVSQGGSVLMTEVPEMFGAERFLMQRCCNKTVYHRLVTLIQNYKAAFARAGVPVYENPSPGNREGGITTLEEKSLGCIRKGGTSPVNDILSYGQAVRQKGLSLLDAPGYDLVSASALALSGAHLILFTTGRGTPFSSPVPTLKIATNSTLASHKGGWIDFDAGSLLHGLSLPAGADSLFQLVLDVASGKRRTRSEQNGFRELAILKHGVTT